MKKTNKISLFEKKWVEIVVISLVIIFSVGIRIVNLNYNSPFSDEALYIVLGQKILENSWQEENPFAWVSSMPLLYPPLAAVGYQLGGIVGARMLSVVCAVVSIYALYEFVKLWLSRHSKNSDYRLVAVLSAFLLALSPVHLWLSRIALQDMFSFMCIVLGLLFIEKASAFNQKLYFITAAFFHIAAFCAKYTAVIILPGIALYYLFSLKADRAKRVQYISNYAVVIGTFLFGYISIFWAELYELMTSYSFAEDEAVSTAGLVLRYSAYIGVWMLGAIVGWYISFKEKSNQTSLAYFAILGMIPFVFVLVTGSDNAIEQVSLLSLIFLVPFTAIILAKIISMHNLLGIGACLVVVLVLYPLFRTQHYALEQQWVNSASVMEYLRSNSTADDMILTQEDDITLLALKGVVNEQQIIGPYNFSYNNLADEEAYKQAVADSYFTFVQITSKESDFYQYIKPGLDTNYSIVYDEPPYRIYGKNE